MKRVTTSLIYLILVAFSITAYAQEEAIYRVVEEMPEFATGDEAMVVFIGVNMVYPEAALAKKMEGTVYVQFVVNANGELQNIEVLKGMDEACDKEAVRIINSMPFWKPGYQRGIPVKVYVTLPINFNIESYKKIVAAKKIHAKDVYVVGESDIRAGMNDNPVNSSIIEENPSFPGGDSELSRYLQMNLVYPASAKEENIQGLVYVEFVVKSDGLISGVKVLEGIGGGCDIEAARVVRAMPAWIPGKQKGIPVNVYCTIPINFNFE